MLGQADVRGQIGEPEEIAEIVLYLASPASNYINGKVISANGGERSALPPM